MQSDLSMINAWCKQLRCSMTSEGHQWYPSAIFLQHWLSPCTQQIPDIGPMLFYCGPTVCDGGPTLKLHMFNVWFLVGTTWCLRLHVGTHIKYWWLINWENKVVSRGLSINERTCFIWQNISIQCTTVIHEHLNWTIVNVSQLWFNAMRYIKDLVESYWLDISSLHWK